MKIISWNVNGIRAVERRGDLDRFLQKYAPDVLLLQETKVKADQLSEYLKDHPEYHQFYNSAEQPGYAGTAIWLKKKLDKIPVFLTDMPDFLDREGRITRVDFDDIAILSIYFPNGGKSESAWQEKLVFYDAFLNYVNALRAQGKKVIWGGDVNCAHEEIDLARPQENEHHIGFLPEERAWLDKVIAADWVDIFRSKYPEKVMYSWWHVISRARERNVGWRIDYFFVDTKLFSKVRKIEYLNEQMGSDHCPVSLEIESS